MSTTGTLELAVLRRIGVILELMRDAAERGEPRALEFERQQIAAILEWYGEELRRR